MKILLADKLSPSVAIFLKKNQCQVIEDPSLKEASLLHALTQHQPEVLVVRSTKVPRDHILQCSSLALIIRAGAGVNNIDLKTASERGVFVANCPGRNAIAVAELAIGHMINLDRKISDNVSDFRSGIWAKKKYSKAKGLHGKKLALFGLGAIGTEVLRRAKAFGMEVTVWSVPFSPEEAKERQVRFAASPQEAATGADILSVHLPLVDQTRGIVDHSVLAKLNDSAFVINTSRGELINEEALQSAIESKNLRAGLDVFCNEPASNDNEVSSPLSLNQNIYVTHHIGASTEQATDSVGTAVISIVAAWKEKGEVLNCVNLAQSTPADHCLTVRHADQVGVLANVLEALKSTGHNVQEMENIIFQGGTAACARIQIVGQPSTSLLQTINQLPHVYASSVSRLNEGDHS